METLFIFGVVLVVMLFGIGAYYYNQKQEQARKAAIGQLADSLGLSFHPLGDFPLQDRLSVMQLFKFGRDRRLDNLLTGETEECRISIFDYRYTTGSGKQSHTTKLTVAALESPRLKIPAFTLRPENFFDKIGGMLGLQDIDFADHPEFSSSFVLKGSEEQGIRQLFARPLQDFFLERKGCCVEAYPGVLVYYFPGKRRKPDEFAGLLEAAYQVFGVIVDR